MKSPNFYFLASYDPQVFRTALQAERYVFDDPNIALIKLRQFGELLAHEKRAFEEHLARLLAEAKAAPEQAESIQKKARLADEEIDLDEAATRRLIDEQLCEAGWFADSRKQTYSNGIRPRKARIWP